VFEKTFLQSRSELRRRFLQCVSQSGEKIREFLLRPIEYIAGEKAAAGAKFEDLDFCWAIERLPNLFELPG
jgi:hypothetical protein